METQIRKAVRDRYANAITGKVTTSSCCKVEGCCETTDDNATRLYGPEEIANLPADLLIQSFGCGNPIALAQLNPGETVLDLGSGAGLDVLLSAKRVGPSGKVYGLDMTDEMLSVARANQAKSGLRNVEFLKGYIEDIPLPDNTVDVVISNCVINLSGDKAKVLQEALRVLKPGGRLAVSDIVLTKPLPDKVQKDLLAWAGCIAGALLDSEYRALLNSAGFDRIEIEEISVYEFTGEQVKHLIAGLTPLEREELQGSVISAFVRARKPAQSTNHI